MFAGKPIIGLSGGIASGKSFVAGAFGRQGCLVLDADAAARRAYEDPAVLASLRAAFGEEAFGAGGRPDRRYLASLVFSDPQLRKRLEGIVHPYVHAERERAMREAASDPAVRAFVWDVPLLFDVGLYKECDALVFVDADDATRAARAAGRGWGEGELARRESTQFPLDRKRALSQYVVRNDPSDPPGALDDQVRWILSQVLGQNWPRV